MKVLIDSDALYAMFLAEDSSHKAAAAAMRVFVDRHDDLYVSNLVLQEVATVLSYRFGQKIANEFIFSFEKTGFVKLFVDEGLTHQSWQLFKKQTKKGTSFVDCSNLVICREMKFEAIFSFDKFYPRNKIKIVS